MFSERTHTSNMSKDQPKIALVTSSGGHLTQLHMLSKSWESYDRFWVTFDKEDANTLLKDETVHHCYYPTNRSLKNLIKNTGLAIKLLVKERPDVIVSTGAAVAVPFFYIGKLLGAKTVYVEIFDRIDTPTLTGKLVHPVTDEFVVQWESMTNVYKNSKNFGGIF